jgi:hypothetical protein
MRSAAQVHARPVFPSERRVTVLSQADRLIFPYVDYLKQATTVRLSHSLNSKTVKAASTLALLADFAWYVFRSRPPYSPDLAPSDFHLFTHLKHLSGGHAHA